MEHHDTSLCILSPECELYICDEGNDGSTDRWVTSNLDKRVWTLTKSFISVLIITYFSGLPAV